MPERLLIGPGSPPSLDPVYPELSPPLEPCPNIVRITLTGILHETISGQIADKFYHDLAGWVMIPFALVLYWCEIWVFSLILVEAEKTPVLVGISSGRRWSANRSPQAVTQSSLSEPRALISGNSGGFLTIFPAVVCNTLSRTLQVLGDEPGKSCNR